MKVVTISIVDELVNAVGNQAIEVIRVKGKKIESPSLNLSPGQQLISKSRRKITNDLGCLDFDSRCGGDGLTLLTGPYLYNCRLHWICAIWTWTLCDPINRYISI